MLLAKLRPRLTYANVVSTLCLFSVLGGGAYAAVTSVPDSHGVFHGCVDRATHVLRVVTAAKHCVTGKKGEFPIVWNQRGRMGPKGAPGARGKPGLPGVNGNGPAYYYVGGGPVPGGSVDTVVLDKQPPAGASYLFNASVLDSTTGNTTAAPDELECSLGVGASAQTARYFGGGEATASVGEGQESFGLTGATLVAAGEHVFVVCRDGSDKTGTPGSATVWLTATRVTNVVEP